MERSIDTERGWSLKDVRTKQASTIRKPSLQLYDLNPFKNCLSIAVVKNFTIRQFDVKTALLYGDIDEIIFIVQSKGFDDGSSRVCRLRKSLYGLKQAPRQWHRKLDDALKIFRLKSINYDSCVYSNLGGSLLLALYIDDG